MVRKKRVKKRVEKRNKKIKSSSSLKKKLQIVIYNLFLFIALSLVSFVLNRFLQNNFLTSLFFIMTIIFGFVAVAFLISFLVLFIVKKVSEK